MPGLAQDGDPSPPASLGGDGSIPSGAYVIQQCERLLGAADAGDGVASTQFGELYEWVHLRALYEATFDPMDKHATPIAPQIDDWLLQRANGGSAAAQYWMAARDTLKGRRDPADPAEAARWYRLSAEQGFPRAELALGQLLISFNEFAREPDEAELWLYRAALHEEERADAYLPNRLRQRAANGDLPRDEIVTWVESRAATGDDEAQSLLDLIRREKSANP
jgi:TPR repeat protein